MGLAASQARLLTITARKSDCEYKSMAYSHQKIALSRDMNAISAEYEAALEQTKLVYDFYGSGDTTTPLSYGLLMTPSVLNDYMPSPITDQSGRVVLNAALASAAEAAGIPQEGLGCTPSSDVRNAFVDGLINAGVVTTTIGRGIQSVTYNPYAGLGSSELVTTSTKSITFAEFIDEYLANIEVNFADITTNVEDVSAFKIYDVAKGEIIIENGVAVNSGESTSLSLKKLINGDYVIYSMTPDHKTMKKNDSYGEIVDIVGSCSFWDSLYATLSDTLDPNDAYAQAALNYAMEQTMRKVECLGVGARDKDNGYGQWDISNNAYYGKSNHSTDTKVENQAKDLADEYVGFCYIYNKKKDDDNGYNDAYALDLSNMTNAFFTYFAQYMDGLATTDYKVTNEKSSSNFVIGDASNFSFDVVEEVDTTGDNLMIANFYDTLFNQIAMNGWTKNEHVDDTEYLQTMLKSGAMYISTMDEDDYYYQNNYATNTYVKEVTDEEGIALAEAKYNREKEKINYKENIIDMKMKNLDTEISSLNTEYETVKSVISKNVSKCFKRYSA